MVKVYINNRNDDDGGGFPHLLHFVLTVLTCGLWLPVWAMLWFLKVLTG